MKVPILLRKIHLKAIELLIENRESAGVAQDNPYIFARNNYKALSPLDACKELRTFSAKAELSKPELKPSTKLRKQVATYAQQLSLDSTELEQLAQFMGHSLNIHMDYYRLPCDVVQIAKLSKILLAMEDCIPVKVLRATLNDVT